MKQIKVLLVDDHKMITDGLRMILDMSETMSVVGSASNGQEAIDFISENHVDVTVMDISMPVMNGLEASKIIKEKFQHIKIVILTSYHHRKLVHELIELNIDGCLIKDQSSTNLTKAIERVMDNKSYFDNLAGFNHVPEKPILGNREADVLREYCLNKSYAEIAEKLKVSKLTVKTHLRNIRKKLNLEKASDLIEYSIDQGLI